MHLQMLVLPPLLLSSCPVSVLLMSSSGFTPQVCLVCTQSLPLIKKAPYYVVTFQIELCFNYQYKLEFYLVYSENIILGN